MEKFGNFRCYNRESTSDFILILFNIIMVENISQTLLEIINSFPKWISLKKDLGQ